MTYPLTRCLSQTDPPTKICVSVLTAFVSERDVSRWFPTRGLTTYMSATTVVGDIILVNSDMIRPFCGHDTAVRRGILGS